MKDFDRPSEVSSPTANLPRRQMVFVKRIPVNARYFPRYTPDVY